jgi:antitoxin component of MazEF toxin-antitoxin module
MLKKLARHGNSVAVVLDKPVLDLLHVKAGGMVEVLTDGKDLVLSPVRDKAAAQELTAWLPKADKKYHKAFKRLAE